MEQKKNRFEIIKILNFKEIFSNIKKLMNLQTLEILRKKKISKFVY